MDDTSDKRNSKRYVGYFLCIVQRNQLAQFLLRTARGDVERFKVKVSPMHLAPNLLTTCPTSCMYVCKVPSQHGGTLMDYDLLTCIDTQLCI